MNRLIHNVILTGCAVLLTCVWVIADINPENPLPLNTASYQDIQQLPVSPELAKEIWEHLYYQGPFESIYQLRQVPGMDQTTFNRLKSLVRIDPPTLEDERSERLRDAYARLEELAIEEGASSSLAEEWIERMVDPLNVNTATLDELNSLENVSPIDALAIWTQVRNQGDLRSARDLRSVPGLSSWGYRNARRYLGYEDPIPHLEIHGRYQFLAYNTPYFTDEDEVIRWETITHPRPDLTHKLQLTRGHQWSAGVLYHRNFGEENQYSINGSDFRIPEMKIYLSARDIDLGPVNLKRTVIGNFRVGFGQGLVMDNTDIWSPRRTGYGWNPRQQGVSPDLSRSQEYALRGIAVEGSWKNLTGIGFLSSDLKDAILNPDGSINRMVTLVPRMDYDIYPENWVTLEGDTFFVPAFEGNQSMLDAVREMAFGGQLRFRPIPGAHIGLEALEILYDRPLHPTLGESYTVRAQAEGKRDTLIEVFPLMQPEEIDEIADSPQNAEALLEYHSDAESRFWGNAKSARRIFGIDIAATIANLSLQAEIAQINTEGVANLTLDDPMAAVMSAYFQYNVMNLLVLYRHYDVDFDNPYNRGFANYRRYKGATFEDSYYLRDATFGALFVNNAIPQAEDGVYISSRFQVARPLVLALELDNWTRLADGAEYYRWVIKSTYRPIWPMQLYLRQRFQARGHLTMLPPGGYDSVESRLEVRFNLSHRDRLVLLYTTSTTRWPPRPRLSGNLYPDGTSPLSGNQGDRSEAIGATITHNISDNLSFRAFGGIYRGFLWTFEDTDFIVLDGQAFRWWLAVNCRPKPGLALRMKVTGENQFPITNVAARGYNEPIEPEPGKTYTADNVQNRSLTYRLQLLYFF